MPYVRTYLTEAPQPVRGVTVPVAGKPRPPRDEPGAGGLEPQPQG